MAQTLFFQKMHGLGNDFVVIDARNQAFAPAPNILQHIANRKTGIGCDQIIVLENPRDKAADIFMRIINADGSDVEACGNATRCVAHLIANENKKTHITVQTIAGLLECEIIGENRVRVDMGMAKLDWRDIPLRDACDTAAIPIEIANSNLPKPIGVNMGNPHAVFFIDNVERFDVAKFGPMIERHPMFPQKTNVEFVQILDRGRVRMRVWERGAGITSACGSGACAVVVAGVIKNLTNRNVSIIMDGGALDVEYLRDGHVLMTGDVATSFTGQIEI